MQNTPTPYQRNRRAARIAAEEPAVSSAPVVTPQQADPAYQTPEQPAVQPALQHPATPSAMPARTSYNAAQYVPRTPVAAPQQPQPQQAAWLPPMQQQPVAPQSAAYPYAAPAVPVQPPSPQPSGYPYTARPAAAPAARTPSAEQPSQSGLTAMHAASAGNHRPRSLQQRPTASSGWSMPTAPGTGTSKYASPPRSAPAGERPRAAYNSRYEPPADPPVERRRTSAAPEAAKQPRRSAPARKHSDSPAQPVPREKARTPGWLLTALSLSLIGVMALVAANFLMQAYLKTDADERQAAYESILYNYHVTEQGDGTLRVTWQDMIEKYAAQYNLQPAFVTAVIRNESSFRTEAESSAGARGLMQMMPDTAEWVAGKLNDSYDFDKLYNAETSIRYGCWYLNYLSELFRGDPVLVCAAYHAGQGEVWGWLGDPAISPDGVTVPIQNIPIGNTKTYAGRVTQAYGIYQTLLYPQEPPVPSAVAVHDHGAAADDVRAAAEW